MFIVLCSCVYNLHFTSFFLLCFSLSFRPSRNPTLPPPSQPLTSCPPLSSPFHASPFPLFLYYFVPLPLGHVVCAATLSFGSSVCNCNCERFCVLETRPESVWQFTRCYIFIYLFIVIFTYVDRPLMILTVKQSVGV